MITNQTTYAYYINRRFPHRLTYLDAILSCLAVVNNVPNIYDSLRLEFKKYHNLACSTSEWNL
jgi:hypothetical protein